MSKKPCVHITHTSLSINTKLIQQYNIKSGEDFLKQIYKKQQVHYPKFYKMDNLSKLGFLACELLLTEHQLEKKQKENMALIFANSGSSIDVDTRYVESMQETPSPALFVYTLSNIMQGEIAIRHKIYGENLFLILPAYNEKLLEENASFILEKEASALIGWVEYINDTKFEAKVSFYEKH